MASVGGVTNARMGYQIAGTGLSASPQPTADSRLQMLVLGIAVSTSNLLRGQNTRSNSGARSPGAAWTQPDGLDSWTHAVGSPQSY